MSSLADIKRISGYLLVRISKSFLRIKSPLALLDSSLPPANSPDEN